MIPRLSAAPSITYVANAASNLSGSQSLGLGGIFIIKGFGLGPANITFAAAPFQSTTLSGTSVTVTSGTTTLDALMYYTSANQVAALLPSSTPISNTATFTVTYNGQISNSVTHAVALRNVGMFTLDSSGQGPAIVTYVSDYSLVSALRATNCGGPYTACGAANPGDTLSLWTTGLGPVSGNEAAGDGLGQDMPTAPLTLWIGGVQAPVIYRGRSGCCVGLDQIVFTVPANVPTGCAVPMVVQIKTGINAISNTALLPVANGSRNCTPTSAALATLDPAQLLNATSATIGDIDLKRSFNAGGGLGYLDQASFQFSGFTFKPGMQPFFLSYADEAPPGTCVAYFYISPTVGIDKVMLGDSLPITNVVALDGGPSVTVSGPAGSATVTASNGSLVQISTAGKFLSAGSFTVTGSGGNDVGPFTASIGIPAVPSLVSLMAGGSVTAARVGGMPVRWLGGDPNATVMLTIWSPSPNSPDRGHFVQCRVAAGAGAFTIPEYMLLPLFPGTAGQIMLGLAQTDAAFTATGLNLGTLHTESTTDGATLTLQ